MIRFTAHCARDHERVDFTDPAAFEQHMMGTHKARKPSVPRPGKPRPWKAPKAPANTTELARVLATEPDWITDVDVSGAPTPGTWRWDGDTDAPTHLLPASLRPILEGAMRRGERWALKLSDDGGLHVSVGRTVADQAGFSVRDGRATAVRMGRHTAAKITDVKRAFPAPGVDLEDVA